MGKELTVRIVPNEDRGPANPDVFLDGENITRHLVWPLTVTYERNAFPVVTLTVGGVHEIEVDAANVRWHGVEKVPTSVLEAVLESRRSAEGQVA